MVLYCFLFFKEFFLNFTFVYWEYVSWFSDTGDQTQGLLYAMQMVHHWVTGSALEWFLFVVLIISIFFLS